MVCASFSTAGAHADCRRPTGLIAVPPAYEQVLLISSCWELVWPFRNCKCKHDPRQVPTGRSGHSYLTLDEAQRITEGIRYLLESSSVGHSIVPVYPQFDSNRPIARAQPGGEPNRGVYHRAVPSIGNYMPRMQAQKSMQRLDTLPRDRTQWLSI